MVYLLKMVIFHGYVKKPDGNQQDMEIYFIRFYSTYGKPLGGFKHFVILPSYLGWWFQLSKFC